MLPMMDSTPTVNMSNFELLYSLKAYNKIPVAEYVSKKTGLTVVIAEVDGPVVNGFFCLVTEAFDDDGLPHTLEHLIFLGSEEYPYKGVLDLLANRCLASGTNAWTDIDHTCYTMETAGSEGFLALMPIFLDHILYPCLTEEGFVTEVHHITGEGEDAGVIYCEMQGRENSAESRLHLTLTRNLYPGKCGYSSETGGIMKNLRESTSNQKVRNYHKQFYRPENLKIIITGKVKPEEVFGALEKLEHKILSKGLREPFRRPWEAPVPPITCGSQDLVINFPTDDEANGLFCIAWRGPSCVKDLYTVTSINLLLKYLTELSSSHLPKEFVEIDDPYASKVSYNLYEYSEISMYVEFEDVPVNKLSEIRPRLQNILKKIYDEGDINMERMKTTINRHRLENISSIECNPHHAIAFMIIGHMLYGYTKADLEQRVNPLTDLDKLLIETKDYWLGILKKYFIDNVYIAVQCIPSKEEQLRMAKEEKERIENQIKHLGEEGLKEKVNILEQAIKTNGREPPIDMLQSVPIPSLKSINFHNLTRYNSGTNDNRIDFSKTPIFTYFDHLNTNFAYIFVFLDTSKIPENLRLYLPLLVESLLELPIEKDGKIIPYEEVVFQLNSDTVSTSVGIGVSKGGLFKCGPYANTVTMTLQVETAKYTTALEWVKNLLYNTIFTIERLKVIATKMINSVPQIKRSGRNMVSYLMRGLNFVEESNIHKNGVLIQHKFLMEVLKKLESPDGDQIVKTIESLRKLITHPQNMVLYIAANLDNLKDVTGPINNILSKNMDAPIDKKPLNSIPDYKFLNDSSDKGCIVGMGCLESSFFYQTVKSINSPTDPDLPVLMLYLEYLIQAEGPMWRQIRGKGFAYGYTMMVHVNDGLLYLVYSRASNVVAAYKETVDILAKQLKNKEWDATLIESAKSSLIFKLIDEENTIGNVVSLSVMSYFQDVDYKYNRQLLHLIETVTSDDLNRIGEKYILPLLDVGKVKTAVVTDPSKAADIAQGFKKYGLDLKIYNSLEDSFLNKD